MDIMFKLNNIEQVDMFSIYDRWTPYQKSLIDTSWVGNFHNKIFPNINEEIFRPLYANSKEGRSNDPINVTVSLFIIKSITNATDEEVFHALLFDTRIQYALHIANIEDIKFSKNIMGNFRRKIREYYEQTGINLLEVALKELNGDILELADVDKSVLRRDSLMISDSCKKLSRIELVYTVNHDFIKYLSVIGIEVKEEYQCYLNEKHRNEVIYRTRDEEGESKLETLLNTTLKLYEEYKENSQVNNSESFKLLERIITEQYNQDESKPKENKEISSTSLQTPYDPNSTYRHKYKDNKGYVADVVEAVNNGKPMVTDWNTYQNVKSDAEIMKEHLESLEDSEENKETKVTEITDGAYYSNELKELAETKNVELHPTELVGKKSDCGNLTEFKIDEESHEVLACPNGCKPVDNSYNDTTSTITAKFDRTKCERCPLKDKCVAYNCGKKASTLKTTVDKYNNALQREKQHNPEYQAVSNLRAAVEGIPSVLRRRYHIDTRANKGQVCLNIDLSCAMLAINIKRMANIFNKLIIHIIKLIKKHQFRKNWVWITN